MNDPWKVKGRYHVTRQIPFIDLKTASTALQASLQARMNAVLDHGQYIMGPEVAELENSLQALTGSPYCITVSSGTEALLISLMALGVGPGDEVITTPFTFIATVEVIVLLGATPVFVDVEADTCNIDATLVEAAITERTRAIIPVSLYGQVPDMTEINQLAHTHGLKVIEDAAQSFGATYQGKKSCNVSGIACTSFFPSKPLGCFGDGGAIFTDDEVIANACREIRVHGQSQRYVHTRVGVGGRMDTLQCAVVLAKLERFEWEVGQRLLLGESYNARMDEIGIMRVQQKPDRDSVFAQYTIFVDQRDRVQAELESRGIPTAVHYPVPLNEQPAYRHLGDSKRTPVSATIAKRVMSLPMSPDLALEDQAYIVDKLGEVVARFSEPLEV
ncbi:DegT/DnrJ/EryC1/StrS family aminotransferase [Granulosicoccus sp. 3-233]|uniref:DegT/DnrJ/EryC1/StrS family aminotransferase n=1 Tax=Granulosicoccus sp. 3-233 TaxID=3417969 RepID=UPI003D32BC8E